MNNTTLQRHLASIGACWEARTWAGERTAQQAWDECERADWLLWWAARTSINTRESIVLAACDCARSVLQHVLAGEDRPRLAIEAAERWAQNPTEDNRIAARAAEWAAEEAARAAWAAAWAAAEEAAEEARAAAGAARAAEWAAEEAAEEAAWAAAWAAARAAEAAAHKEMCSLVRSRLVAPFVEGADNYGE